jgi:mycothiol synthase
LAETPTPPTDRHHEDGTIDIPEAPPIEGLRFRLYRGPEDIPAIAAVGRAAAEADGDNDPWSVARLRVEYANLTNSDPTRDCVLAEVDGRLVAFARVQWNDNTDGSRSYVTIGHVHPAWRRRGIGRALLRHDERRLAIIAAAQRSEAPRWYTTWALETEVGAVHLYESEGYRRVRTYLHMVRPHLEDIAVPPLPDGLEIRPIRAEDVRAVFDAAVEAFRDHFGEFDGSDAEFARWSEDPTFDRDLLVVAWAGAEVAGAVQAAVDIEENEREGYRRGWTDPVFVRRPWRRRGLASTLLARALLRLREAGMTSAQLDVDAENPHAASELYARLGFTVERSSGEWRRPLEPHPPELAPHASSAAPLR